jgi:hypothetical protein
MVVVPARQATKAGGSGSLESIPGLLKRFTNSGFRIIGVGTTNR